MTRTLLSMAEQEILKHVVRLEVRHVPLQHDSHGATHSVRVVMRPSVLALAATQREHLEHRIDGVVGRMLSHYGAHVVETVAAPLEPNVRKISVRAGQSMELERAAREITAQVPPPRAGITGP